MKYMIKLLKARCVNYLLENLTVENVLLLLQYCLDCDIDERLLLKCRDIFRSNIKDVLKPGFIGSFNEKCLIFLLEDDELTVEEIDLFKAVCFLIYDSIFYILHFYIHTLFTRLYIIPIAL